MLTTAFKHIVFSAGISKKGLNYAQTAWRWMDWQRAGALFFPPAPLDGAAKRGKSTPLNYLSTPLRNI